MRAGIVASGLHIEPPLDPATLEGLELWLEGSDLDHLSDGSPVSLWNDRSGHGRHAIQNESSAMPKKVSINGVSAVAFNGVAGTFLRSTASAGYAEMTMMTAIRLNSGTTSTYQTVLGGHAATSLALEVVQYNPYVRTWGKSGAVRQWVSLAPDEWFALGCSYDIVTLSSIYSSAVGSASLSHPLNIGSEIIVGAKRHDGIDPLNGQIAEAMVFSTALGSSTVTDIIEYFSSKYNVGA